jgi:hypothetical protein
VLRQAPYACRLIALLRQYQEPLPTFFILLAKLPLAIAPTFFLSAAFFDLCAFLPLLDQERAGSRQR